MLFSFNKCQSNETLIESNLKQHDLKLAPSLKENDWKQKIVVGSQGTSVAAGEKKAGDSLRGFLEEKRD
ncbi:hypothetical protein JOC94_004115 [Bacillus thermophilus]|uniref:Uncharacterized protein n=1 Tax=Siminovitchia thermophila TaxID=1245522 RepID=A0ABS2RES3_9BACI|nr:hypothetical protein [Siminovitchia thermophila]MBM7717091.1 hypothetical protein [Siminovitchia thermophila]ONK25116.1 hypothetical protein BLX87_01325 [Bacillus sp. VT-16-64]